MLKRLKVFLDEHEIIRNSEAESLGVSRAVLCNLVAEGRLQRLAQGVYALPEMLPDELVLIAGRSPNIVFSHETALSLHQLHNRIPDKPTLTLPQTCRTPHSIADAVKVYRVKSENHDLGRTEVNSFLGHKVPCYDPERTICDIIRSYSRIDIETYTNALRTYVKSPVRNLPRLMAYARALGMEKKVHNKLEVLL